MLRNSRRLFLLLLAVAALGYLFYKFRHSITLEGFQWSTVGQSLRDARLSLLVLTMATIYVCFAIRALRWMRFSRTLGATHFANVYSATLMGFTCTFLLGRAGEPIRPVLIAKKDKLSIPRMFGVYVLERIFDVAATAIIAGSALVLFERRGLVGNAGDIVTKVRSAGILLLVGLLVAVCFLIYFRYHGAEWLTKRLQKPAWRVGWRGKVIVLLEGFAEGLQGIRTWNDLGVLVGLSVVHWFLIVLCYTWVAHAFGGQLGTLSFSDAALVLAFSMVGSAVQLPGIGGGAQVATFLVLTLIFGVEKVPAATMSVVVWLVTFASCCLVGLPLLFREGWSMGELRKMATAAEQEAESVAEEIVLGGHPAKPGDETR
jgi:glycosyltransferase 2 family protein